MYPDFPDARVREHWANLFKPDQYKVAQDAPLLLVGNSVTATLDSSSLSAEMGVSVQNIAMEGSLPAHWTAFLAQARIRYNIKPKKVVLYVTANNLFRTKLTDEEDISMLKQLSPEYVDGLSIRALGVESSFGILQNRIPLQKIVYIVERKYFFPVVIVNVNF